MADTIPIRVVWEVDNEDGSAGEEVTMVELPKHVWKHADSVADWLSDKYGYLVKEWNRVQ